VASSSFDRNLTKIKTVAAGMLLLLAVAMPAAVGADQKPITADKTREAQKIHITSDRLESQPNNNLVEFIGNVHVRQGNTTISSDRLKIYYQGGIDTAGKSKTKKGKKGGGEESIKKIVAQGNVIIKIDERIAVADKAQYTPGTGEIILTGKHAKITEGANFVSGEKITFNRRSNRITVQRSGKQRVEAVFFSETVDPAGITGGGKKKKQ